MTEIVTRADYDAAHERIEFLTQWLPADLDDETFITIVADQIETLSRYSEQEGARILLRLVEALKDDAS